MTARAGSRRGHGFSPFPVGLPPGGVPRTPRGSCDSVALRRFLLRAAAAGGADPRRLAHDAGLPAGILAREEAMLLTRYYTRLWELVEWALEQPLVPLTIAVRHQFSELSLYDYLFTSAATGRRIVPVRMTCPSVAPPSRRLLVEAFGTRQVVFPAPRPATFPEIFRLVLARAIEQGTPALGKVAARLALSPRTLQRRLTEHGTSWREELDTARRTGGADGSCRL